MRFVMRSLVVLSFPTLALGWLTTAGMMPGSPEFYRAFPPDSTAALGTFLLCGVVLLVAGSIALTLGDLGRAFRSSSTTPLTAPRPIALPVVVLAALAGVGVLSMSRLHLDASAAVEVWMQVVLTAAGGFVALLAVTVAIRSLVGLWGRADLAMWPGRRAATILLLLVALAATPVSGGGSLGPSLSGNFASVVPLVERVHLELSNQVGWPTWSYDYDDGVSGLL